MALAATGGRGPLHWSVAGKLARVAHPRRRRPAGSPAPLPRKPAEPLALELRVSDGDRNSQPARPAAGLTLPGARRDRALVEAITCSAVPWRAWLEQGVGFLVLWLVHLLGMNLLANLERGSLEESVLNQGAESAQLSVQKRFASYRLLVRLTTLTAMIALAVWLVLAPASRALKRIPPRRSSVTMIAINQSRSLTSWSSSCRT